MNLVMDWGLQQDVTDTEGRHQQVGCFGEYELTCFQVRLTEKLELDDLKYNVFHFSNKIQAEHEWICRHCGESLNKKLRYHFMILHSTMIYMIFIL